MIKDVKTFKPEDTLAKVVKVFAENGISGAPVVDDETKVVGIITEHDIIKLREEYQDLLAPMEISLPLEIGLSIKNHGPEKVAKALNGIKDKRVGDAMSKKVVTASPGAGIGEIARMLQENKINRIPIVDKEGKLLGLMTRADVIKGFLKK